MKKKVNKYTDQLLAHNSEILIIKKRKVEKQCRERKKRNLKKPQNLLSTGMVRITQQLPLKILMLDESNGKLSTAWQ